jgi:hypothetical protein
LRRSDLREFYEAHDLRTVIAFVFLPMTAFSRILDERMAEGRDVLPSYMTGWLYFSGSESDSEV